MFSFVGLPFYTLKVLIFGSCRPQGYYHCIEWISIYVTEMWYWIHITLVQKLLQDLKIHIVKHINDRLLNKLLHSRTRPFWWLFTKKKICFRLLNNMLYTISAISILIIIFISLSYSFIVIFDALHVTLFG